MIKVWNVSDKKGGIGMADRAKVITDVEEAIKILSKVDEPTFRLDFVRVAVENALKLLIAQEPRVLTYDELMALPHGIETDVPVVMETKTPVGKWDGGSMCQWKPAGFMQEMVQDHRWYNREHYGEFWRVWNVRPTVAQREAVKWDG